MTRALPGTRRHVTIFLIFPSPTVVTPHPTISLGKLVRLPDLSLPGACEGPIPLTRDKLVIDPHTGKPNCPSKVIDIGSRIVYPQAGESSRDRWGDVNGSDVKGIADSSPGRPHALHASYCLRSLYFCLFVCLSSCLSICLSVCLSVYL